MKKRHLIILPIIVASWADAQVDRQKQVLKKAAEESRGSKVNELKKKTNILPEVKTLFENKSPQVLTDVQPPKNSEIYSQVENKNQSSYEKALDAQISELYKLTQKFKSSPNRGELWLRLAELYIEKAGMVNDRIQTEYDQKLSAYQAGQLPAMPELNVAAVREFNQKAVLLYEWFLRDFAGDEKTDQALFYLGYQNFEIGKPEVALTYYQQLVNKYPSSRYASEAHFALAESYFDRQMWNEAFKEYAFIVQDKKNALHTISVYKTAWCLFRTGQIEAAITNLDQVMNSSQVAQEISNSNTTKKLDTTRLENEAINDLVVFFAETSDMDRAITYFKKLESKGGSEAIVKLAALLSSKGSYENARKVYKYLIAQDPLAKKSFDYQYQIVQDYFFFKKETEFKTELYQWIETYNFQSNWYAAHKKDLEFLKNSDDKRELTLRNYILQQHQTAQNSRAEGPQLSAQQGYNVYFKEFHNSQLSDEMRFFYGELLYDLKAYPEAAEQYQIVVSQFKSSRYHEKASQNLMISLEKGIPKDEEFQKLTENSVEQIALTDNVKKFIQASNDYLAQYPQNEKNAEIKFRIGRLYYLTNNFGPAEAQFKEIVQKFPKTKFSEYSANLLLDIYNLKKDYAGLEKMGSELLTDQSIVNTKLGDDIRNVMEKASFIKAQNLEASKKYVESAEHFNQFAAQNTKSKLFAAALFNAAVNYERAGQSKPAIEGYEKVMSLSTPEAQDLKAQTKKLLVKMYQSSGQFEKAGQLYAELVQVTPAKDPLSANFIFNSALMMEILGQKKSALDEYSKYRKVATNEDEKADLLFKVAELNRQTNAKLKAMLSYKQYTELRAARADLKIQAHYWVYQLARELKDPVSISKILSTIEKLLGEVAADKKNTAQSFEAKLKLEQAQDMFNKLKLITMPSQASQQKKAVDKKLELMNNLNDQLAEVIKIDSPHEIVSALSLVAQANEDMANTFKSAPVPADLDEESKKIYLEELNKIIEPFTQKSVQSYKLAVERGRSLQVYNADYKLAYSRLSYLQPADYFDNKEAFAESREVSWYLPQAPKGQKVEKTPLEKAIDTRDQALIGNLSIEALKINSNDVVALNALAIDYYQKNLHEASKTLLNRTLAANVNIAAAYNNLALIALAQNETREALQQLTKAQSLDEKNQIIALNLSWIYLANQDYDKVLQVLEKFVQNNLLDKKGLQYYAIALRAKNKLKEADRIYDKISRL